MFIDGGCLGKSFVALFTLEKGMLSNFEIEDVLVDCIVFQWQGKSGYASASVPRRVIVRLVAQSIRNGLIQHQISNSIGREPLMIYDRYFYNRETVI